MQFSLTGKHILIFKHMLPSMALVAYLNLDVCLITWLNHGLDIFHLFRYEHIKKYIKAN